jgi:hypothetical protein
MMMKWPTVVAMARSGNPAPQAIPKSANHVAPHEDDPAPDEANPRHDLRGDTRRIKDNPAARKDVHEPVFRNQHNQGSGDADKGMGSEARALLTDFPFYTHYSRQDESESQLRELQPALAGEIQKPAQ